MVYEEGQEAEEKMSTRVPQNASALLDAVLAIVGLAVVGMVVYNFITLRLLAGTIDTNEMHACWFMEYIFGTPEAMTAKEACLEMRANLPEWWNK